MLLDLTDEETRALHGYQDAAISKANGATNAPRLANAATARTMRQIDEVAVFGMVSSLNSRPTPPPY